MNWNCALTEERLSDYLDATLTAEERQACDVHAAECSSCAGMLASVGELVRGMHALEPVREPAFLTQRIIRNTARARTRPSEIASGWFSLVWQPRFAMGIATVVATFVILAHAAGVRLNNLTPGDLNPLNMAREANRQAHLTYARGEKFVNDLRVVYEIRSVLAAPPEPATQRNQPAPAPNGAAPAAPDTQEHGAPDFERDAAARNAGRNSGWAMLDLAFGKVAPNPANRRPL